MPGTLDVVSAAPDAMTFVMTGQWDRFGANWYHSTEPYTPWYVEGRAPTSGYALPQPPPEVMELAPDLVPSEFYLSTMRVENVLRPGVTQSQGVYFSTAKQTDRDDARWPISHGLPPHTWR